MPKSPNASLDQIRLSIQARRVLEFEYAGQPWKVEPHDLAQNARHSLVLHAWTLEGSMKGTWLVFLYSEMRGCKVLPTGFTARDIPPVLSEWRGPDVVPRKVRRKDFSPKAQKRGASEGGSPSAAT